MAEVLDPCQEANDSQEIDIRTSLQWIREVCSGKLTYHGKQFPIPIETIEPCDTLIRDIARWLMITTFIAQMVVWEMMLQQYAVAFPMSMALRPLWITTAVLALIVFLMLVLLPRRFSALYVLIFEELWEKSSIAMYTPLNGSSTIGLYKSTLGAAYVPHYASWMIYVILALLPRIWWLMLGTDLGTLGHIMPEGFLVFSFIMNLCMSVGYSHIEELDGNRDPFRFFFVVLDTAHKSILAILDAEAILNEVGDMQKTASPGIYIALSLPILVIVSWELLMLTLEVFLDQQAFWSYSRLLDELRRECDKAQSYGRCSLLFKLMYIMLEAVFETTKLGVRLYISISRDMPFSTFIYKNVYVLATRLPHAYSLGLLLVAPHSISAN